VVGADSVWVCTGSELGGALVSEGVVPTERTLVEPSARDTFAAALLGSAVLSADDEDSTVLLLTADHLIDPVDAFVRTAAMALDVAEQVPDCLVTMGVAPDRPATGFGYLQLGERAGMVRRVTLFREKPDLETAGRYVAAGPDRYLWNSGMFAWTARNLLAAADAFHPGAGDIARTLGAAYGSPGFGQVAASLWPGLPSTSVDYGVMEPASTSDRWHVLAVPLEARWQDVGSWTSFGTVLPGDPDGNAVTGRVLSESSRGCIVSNSADDHVVALLGCDDLVVVHTARATLVVPRARAEEVKALHAAVRSKEPDFA
jgi:mannose-1-phosphate guanylyltransferase